MVSSSLGGMSGLIRTGGTGGRSRMELKTSADVSPRNGKVHVHFSYNTAPNENRSVRESSSLTRTCSGNMYATVPSVEPGLVRCCSWIIGVSVLRDAIWFQELRAGATLTNPEPKETECPRIVRK